MFSNIWGLQVTLFMASWASKLGPLGSKSTQNPPQNQSREGSGTLGRTHASAPQERQERPKSSPGPPQDRSKSGLGRLKSAQGRPKSLPRAVQSVQKRIPDSSESPCKRKLMIFLNLRSRVHGSVVFRGLGPPSWGPWGSLDLQLEVLGGLGGSKLGP